MIREPERMPRGGGAAAPLPFWRTEWFLALLLVFATFAAYQHVWRAGFIWDDDMHLTRNPCIVGPQGLADIWTSRAARYFPLVLTTFWVEHAAWGLNPLPYHVVNVLMHAACAVALWKVLGRLRVPGALLGAALWALHPVQVESVAWITELKNTQSCLFYLLSAQFFVKWVSGESRRGSWHYALALFFAALAMASKSSTVVLPLVLGLCAWWMQGKLGRRVVAGLVPVLVMSASSGVLSLWTQHLEGANAPEWTRGVPERVAVAGRVFWFYLGKLAWPHPLMFVYPRWSVDATDPVSYIPTAALCAGLIVLWRYRGGRLRPAFFAFAYFLVALLPVLCLLDQYYWRYSFVGDHFQYLASMGPLALAAAGLTAAFGALGRPGQILKPIVCGGLLAGIAVLSWRQGAEYGDEDTLWRATIALNPGCWMAHNNLGSSYLDAGRVDEAIGQFQAALRARPDFADAEDNLGNAVLRTGNADEAIAHYRKAIGIDPEDAEARSNLGAVLLGQGRVDEAVDQLQRALAIKPDSLDAHYNLGNALAGSGRIDGAITHFKRALEIDPGKADAYSNLGEVLLRKGRTGDAAAQFERALAINPRLPSALVNLGNVLMREGKPGEAAALYLQAIQASPDDAEAHNNLGVALMQEGRPDEAIAHYRKALGINPGYTEAHRNLGNALFKEGRVDEADAQFQQAAPR